MVNKSMNGASKNKTKNSTSLKEGVEDYLYEDKSVTYQNGNTSSYRKGIDFLSYNNGENFTAYTPQKTIPIKTGRHLNGYDDNSIKNEIAEQNCQEQCHDESAIDINNHETMETATNLSYDKAPKDDEDSYLDDLDSDETEWTDSENAHHTKTSFTTYLIPAGFIILFAAWSIFFLFSNKSILTLNTSLADISSLIVDWAVPTILIALGWILLTRNSTAEASRFTEVSNLLRIEAQNVEDKVREINQEIALARDFLSQYSQDLDHIGRHTAENIVNASQQIELAFNESTEKAITLEKVSATTHQNLELLRKNLPVVSSAAKDATNLIGKTGMEAIDHIRSLEDAIKDSSEASSLNRQELEKLSDKNKQISNEILSQMQDIQSFSEEIIGKNSSEIEEIAATLKSEYSDFDKAVSETHAKLDKESQTITDGLQNNIDRLSIALQNVMDNHEQDGEKINNIITNIEHHIETSHNQIEVISDKASDQTAKMAFAMNALKDNSDSVGQGLSDNHAQAELLIERSEKLLLALDSSARELDETIPASVKRLDELFAHVEDRFQTTFSNIQKLTHDSEALSEKSETIEKQVSLSRNQIETLLDKQNNDASNSHDKVHAILATLNQSKDALEALTTDATGAFEEQIKLVNKQIMESLEFSKEAISQKIDFSSERLTDNSNALIQETIDKQIAEIENNLKISLDVHVKAASENVAKLQTQLTTIEEMTDNLEKRLENNSEEFSNIGEESFSRQMALLTESLNSTAIDVAKIISNDVTDTAWAAYLKGDRGVFTRRAVKLLTAGEAKLITAHYDENMEFRDHVNRYIHDFESMMRILLSTRDGNAIGVTILSSDVGKLYVALAQAIERLRN